MPLKLWIPFTIWPRIFPGWISTTGPLAGAAFPESWAAMLHGACRDIRDAISYMPGQEEPSLLLDFQSFLSSAAKDILDFYARSMAETRLNF